MSNYSPKMRGFALAMLICMLLGALGIYLSSKWNFSSDVQAKTIVYSSVVLFNVGLLGSMILVFVNLFGRRK